MGNATCLQMYIKDLIYVIRLAICVLHMTCDSGFLHTEGTTTLSYCIGDTKIY